MRNSRLLQLLTVFSTADWLGLKKAVSSPVFNHREDIIRLFDFLYTCTYKDKKVPRKYDAYRATYGNVDFNEQKLRLVMSRLNKVAEQYLAYQNFMGDEIQVQAAISEVYRQRRLDKHFNQTIKKTQKLLEKSPYRDSDHYEKQYRILDEEYQNQAAGRRIGTLNLQEISNTLDIAYLTQKLRQACFLVAHQAVYKTNYTFGLLNEAIHYVKQQNLLQIPAISIYYYTYMALTHPKDGAYFSRFKSLIFEKDKLFSNREIRDIFLLGINFCIRQYNEGNKTYLNDEFELYKIGLERGYLLPGGIISRFSYRNIVTLGIAMNEYTWVENFIHTYRQKLPNTHKESMYSFCLARLEYSRQNYGEALQLLQKSDYKDLLLNLAAKTVQLKIYYELDEYDLLCAHLEAMQIFIRRKDIMAYHRENYSNTVRFTKNY